MGVRSGSDRARRSRLAVWWRFLQLENYREAVSQPAASAFLVPYESVWGNCAAFVLVQAFGLIASQCLLIAALGAGLPGQQIGRLFWIVWCGGFTLFFLVLTGGLGLLARAVLERRRAAGLMPRSLGEMLKCLIALLLAACYLAMAAGWYPFPRAGVPLWAAALAEMTLSFVTVAACGAMRRLDPRPIRTRYPVVLGWKGSPASALWSTIGAGLVLAGVGAVFFIGGCVKQEIFFASGLVGAGLITVGLSLALIVGGGAVEPVSHYRWMEEVMREPRPIWLRDSIGILAWAAFGALNGVLAGALLSDGPQPPLREMSIGALAGLLLGGGGRLLVVWRSRQGGDQ